MVVFLEIYIKKDRKTVGTLEIVHQVFPGGEVQRAYEWVGAAKGSDGGRWEWAVEENDLVMVLTSNITKRRAADLSSSKWKKDVIPPPLPWFGNDWENFNLLTYIGPNNEEQYFGWRPKT